MTQPKCPLCQKVISPDDTVGSVGHGMAHVACGRPRSLSSEEHVLLYVYCWEPTPSQSAPGVSRAFDREEIGVDPFDSRAYKCRHCGADLTESIRSHLAACTMLPEQLRQRVKEAREVTQRLIKRSYVLSDRADVLIREVEAALDALNKTRERARRKRPEQ